MRTMSARDAKNGFGRLMDMARAEPVTIEKHGRAVVVVLALEEYERLQQTDTQTLKGRTQKGAEDEKKEQVRISTCP